MYAEIPQPNITETDVLIVGGGLAGCMAALKAREKNADVTIIEKSTIRRGGSRGGGPEVVALITIQALHFQK